MRRCRHRRKQARAGLRSTAREARRTLACHGPGCNGRHRVHSTRAMKRVPALRPERRAIIIGGSMSGLFAAAFLRQIGWDAHVYERSAVELVGRGAGITTHPELLEALERR